MCNFSITSLILGLFLFLYSPLSAQVLNLSQILRIHESNDKEREKILSGYGFHLSESAMKELDGAIVPTDYYTWQNTQETLAPIQTMVVVRNAHPHTGQRMETSYILFSETEYTALQLSAWAWGYKYVKEEKQADSIAIFCENENSWLRFFTDKYPNNVVYGVTISDKKVAD